MVGSACSLTPCSTDITRSEVIAMTTLANSGRVSAAWRWTALGLGGVLVVSWGFLGYRILDTAISLDYCRVEQSHLRHDMRLIINAAAGKLSSSAFLAAQAEIDPELPHRLDEDRVLPLRTGILRFREDGILQGLEREEPAVEQ
jgi:hypothetical protein